MSSDKNNSPLFKFAPRHRQALAMTTAAAALVVGLGAFGMLPQVRGLQPVANDAPIQLAQATPRANPPRPPSGGLFVWLDGTDATFRNTGCGRSVQSRPAALI